MLSEATTTNVVIADLCGVRLGRRERQILIEAATPTAKRPRRGPYYQSRERSKRMAWQRAARRLRDLGLIKYEPERWHIRRTILGQRVADRYWEELNTGRPIRWTTDAPQGLSHAQRAQLAELTSHVEGLCKKYRIAWVKPSPSSANPGRFHARPDRRLIRCPKISNRNDYFTALHEIGHLVLGRGDSCEAEAECWVWALENGRVQPTQAVRAMIRRGLSSYLKVYDEPVPQHVFWSLLEGKGTAGKPP